MGIFKCKMCGGSLEVQDGMTVCECDYCGSKQTIPSNSDENIRTLFNRANILRMKAEFDKAEDIYEKILQLNSTESEAYWGLILCKYGVEYVEDPGTMRRVPTCHRTSYDAITADDDYKNAIYYASIEQKIVYESEAKTIDEIQKGILSISQKEDPYDVFICYKEADENGKRTKDSVIANDIYYQLTQQGYKVFYAAITLEDKIGTEYEPYIFSALNSAKVMLVLGTRPEFFTAVWVKNEWSRFLKLMKKDRSKLLIPCYRDMDAYELPEEFAHLQAQDMSKIGFINDIVRGIQKVLRKEDRSSNRMEAVANSQNNAALPLIKRAFMFLEDGEWNKADEFCEQALNIDPENAMAYVGKLMADLHIHHQEDLEKQAEPFSKNNNFKKAIRFADEKLKSELQGYIDTIEYRKLENTYEKAVKIMESAYIEKDFSEAIGLFKSIQGHKDASELAQKCIEQRKELQIKGQIHNAQYLLENAYSEYELEKAIEEIGDGQNIPEISELIKNSKKRFEEYNAVAYDLWKDYLSKQKIVDEIDAQRDLIQENREDIQKKLSSLNEELEEIRKIKGYIRHDGEVLQSEEKTLRELEMQLQQAKNELDKLGIFALGAKKEANARISNLQTLVEQQKGKVRDAQKEIDTLKKKKESLCSEDDIEQRMSLVNESYDRCEQDYSDISAKRKEAELSLGEIRNKIIMTPQYLAVLLNAKDIDLLSRLLSDQVIITVIKSNPQISDVLQQNMFYDALPLEAKNQFKRKKGKDGGLDLEAVYFQACQAMDHPTTNDDIIWAKNQFMSIIGYKDVDTRISKCNSMIAGVE